MRRRSEVRRRTARHGRHGRLGRSSVVRPPLPPLDGRIDRFDLAVSSAAEFLCDAWPELREVSFEVAGMPAHSAPDGMPRWLADRDARRIVVFRIPTERLGRQQGVSELHRRMLVESCVFRAAADYLDVDPWELGAERYRGI